MSRTRRFCFLLPCLCCQHILLPFARAGKQLCEEAAVGVRVGPREAGRGVQCSWGLLHIWNPRAELVGTGFSKHRTQGPW